MTRIFAGILCWLLLNVPAFAQNAKTPLQPVEKDYIFFLHNRFLEENDLNAKHPEYGRAEYKEIISAFENDGFAVISEKRASKTDIYAYADKVVKQIDSLLKLKVKPDHITVIGTSKGGYIAQIVSTKLKNPDINFVFIACFQEDDLAEMPDINYCGNILTIYETSDPNGVSAVKRKEASTLTIKQFKEVKLNTGLRHGFLFKPLKEWIEPCKNWARRNYTLK